MTRDTFCHDGKALTELIDKAINITGMPHMRADKVQTGKRVEQSSSVKTG